MILLFGLLYFGYATLGRQRQDKATAYAAWQSSPPLVADLLTTFWGSALPLGTTFLAKGGSVDGQSFTRRGDEYYNLAINGTIFIPCQLSAPHSISGGDDYVFDSERVTVDLWNYALGATTQSFTWTPGVGAVQQFNTNYTSFARYLNIDANPAGSGLGLLHADNGDPPNATQASNGIWPSACGGLLAGALNGPLGGWLQRRAVESTMVYNDPLFVRYAYADQGAPSSTFGQYISGNNAAPTNPTWQTATMDCDVTIRNPAIMRRGVEEGAQIPGQILLDAGALIGENGTFPAPPPDTTPLDASGNTIAYWWTPH